MNLVSSGNLELGRIGDLTVRIADSDEEVSAAQQLRHRVFMEGATGSGALNPLLTDEDRFDPYCDHLIVVNSENGHEKVVATYRLMGPEHAARAGGYYSQNEFETEKLVASHPGLRFLEFGRSCVLPEYRTKRTMELLWHGSWAFVRKYGHDVMFGCASFPGTDISRHRDTLSYLAEHAAPDPDWRVNGRGEVVKMAEPANAERTTGQDLKSVMRSLPPLIKGYLRLGAMFAEDAVVDRDFGTIDVLVLLPVSRLNPRYVRYYGENAERHKV